MDPEDLFSRDFIDFLFLQVKRTIEEQLGSKVEDLFTKFVNEPLATASVSVDPFLIEH